MRKNLFNFKTHKVPLPDLDPASLKRVIAFARGAFGCSEWVTLRGAVKPYYFNLDKAYSLAKQDLVTNFHDILADRIREVAKLYQPEGSKENPILAFVCPSGAPTGIVQARGALAERMGWESVLVFPDKRLLRSRVIVGQSADHYPEAIRWIIGRTSLLLADTATTGESLARATGALRAFNCEPSAAITVYERNEGAEQSLLTIGLPIYWLFRSEQAAASDMVDVETRNVIHQPTQATLRDLSIFASAAA